MNKDEAERCTEIGLKHLTNKRFTDALRFFEKSDRLFPSDSAKSYIQLTKEKMQNQSTQQQPQEEAKRRVPNREDPKPKAQVGKDYRPDQEQEARRICGIENYYDILGVEKNADENILKKNYRKLALKLHPDKNQAPSATEAFKKISKAFSCLNDPEKRRIYDQHGTEDVPGMNFQGRQGDFGDVWAQQFFRDFFGGDDVFFNFTEVHQGGRRYRYAQQRPQQGGERVQANQYWPLIQLMPLLLLFLFSGLSSFSSFDPPYSLSQTYRYSYLRRTSNAYVPYYVEKGFSKSYANQIEEIEQNVETSYIQQMKHQCSYQTQTKNKLIYQAGRYSGRQSNIYQEKANNVDMSPCNRLDEIRDYGRIMT